MNIFWKTPKAKEIERLESQLERANDFIENLVKWNVELEKKVKELERRLKCRLLLERQPSRPRTLKKPMQSVINYSVTE